MTQREFVRKNNDALTASQDANKYLMAHGFLTSLRREYVKRHISADVYNKARKMALNGDEKGAERLVKAAIGCVR